MKLALALMFQNEAAWLKLHLPVMLPAVDGLVALDGGSTDGSAEVIRALEGTVYERPFDWKFGEHAQALLDHVEAAGYDAILRLDPDELMFPEDIDGIRRELERGEFALLHLPRVNFVRDRLHYAPDLDPYRQWRAWLLNKGISYRHEGTFQPAHETPAFEPGKMGMTKEVTQTIFHYGALKAPYDSHWRNASYQALCANQPQPEYVPVWMDWYPHQRYLGQQPLDPYEVGISAPFTGRGLNFHLSHNLAGDRDIEYRFVDLAIPAGNGRAALDVGSGGVSRVIDTLNRQGWGTTALDYQPMNVPAKTIIGDVLTVELPTFDLIVACSTLEHIGLAGRYGVTDMVKDGDLQAMRRLYAALNPGGLLILTLPVGRDHVHAPMHRVYGGDRLDTLLYGFEVLSSMFWRKVGGVWSLCSKAEACSAVSVSVSERDWQGCLYALGGWVLRKS